LPADASKTVIQFEVYATTSNSNLELQLQEADGDVFSWNLGGDGGINLPQVNGLRISLHH
jgi:hypothetical protein